MKINAVGVSSKNMKKSVEFYSILGFIFDDFDENENHLEPKTKPGQTRLMIDSVNLLKDMLGIEPKPSNHSHFAIEFSSPKEIDEIIGKLRSSNQTIIKEPWDAPWGQRYAVVADPDGYMIDLYAYL